ncbi:MAG: amidohydrolase [Candidatus Aminicenantes bacterium]
MSSHLVMKNGRIWTADPQRPWAEAVAVSGETILAAGSNEEAERQAGDSARIKDLEGAFVCPGFIDSHTHFVDGALTLSGIQLRDADSKEEFIRRFQRMAGKIQPGEWILHGDWDHQNFDPPRLPSREWIDPFTPDNPVCVTRLDKHMVLVNSVALKIAGIGRRTPDPEGGVIDRDPRSGEPTGILKDGAMPLVFQHIPDPTLEERMKAVCTGLKHAHSLGLTSMHDMSGIPDFKVFQELEKKNRLSGRFCVYLPISQIDSVMEFVKASGPGTNRLKFGGLKGFADGSLGSFTALFFDSYTGRPGSRGIMAPDMFPEGSMQERLLEADRAGIQAAVHAIGDKANHIILNMFEHIMQSGGKRDRRWRIEHAQHLIPEDIPRFGKLNVIPSVQPYHAIDDGRWAESKIGPLRSKTSFAFGSLFRSGAAPAFGSDWSVAPLDPLAGIYAAAARKTLDGKNPGGWIPEEIISLEEALKAYTLHAAYAEFAEDTKGSITPGKLADLVVLDQDVFSVPPGDIRSVNVVMTMCGGEVVYQS